MKLPATYEELTQFVVELCHKCEVSMESRRTDYARRRNYFLYGANEGSPALCNKVGPQLDTLTSFIYSAETTRFSVNIGASLDQRDSALALAQIPSINRKLLDEWYDTNSDQVFRLATLWGSVYDTMLIKLVVRNKQVYPFLVEPATFGVLREDLPYLDQQEAFVHHYYMTKSEIRMHLEGHPHLQKILKEITAAPPVEQADNLESRVNNMLISQISPTIQGNTGNPWDGGGAVGTVTPEVQEDVTQVKDLYVWEEDIGQFRVFTIAEPGVLIYDRPIEDVWLKESHAFIKITPDPTPGYFWGRSDVDKLAGLQDAVNLRMQQIAIILNKQADPPYAGEGVSDEQNFAVSKAKGFINLEPNGKLTVFEPEVPSDIFAELDRYESMFSDALGINNVLAGRGESGVRSKGHAAELARLGSSRIKQRALVIEDALEKMAGLYLKALAKYDNTHFHDTDGREFILNQFTKDHFVKVDAHSNSPIFVEDGRQVAFELFDKKVISRVRLLELLDPPLKQQLLEDAKKMDEREAQQAQAQQQQGQQKPPEEGAQQ